MGFETDRTAVGRARVSAAALDGVQAEIREGDFLRWAAGRLAEGASGVRDRGFDAAVGNPPFIRYQLLGEKAHRRSEAIVRGLGLPFTRHANAWVPFVLAALALLRPGGRLAMVVPAEILHVLHAGSVRAYLARECARVLLVDPVELWFEGLLQGAMLLLAERRDAPARASGNVGVVPTLTRAFLREDPEALFRRARYVDGCRMGEKWTTALLSDRERSLVDGVAGLVAVPRLRQIASVDVGIVTGANGFFLVPDAVVERYQLDAFAHPMFGRSGHVRGVVYDRRRHEANRRRGVPANFLWLPDAPLDALPAGLQRYILVGERSGLHRRYKCRVREPWYRVPSVYATPVAMLKRSHECPRLILNAAGAFTTDTAYRVRPTRIAAARLVSGFVNSLTALSAELEGRHYGGGVLELVPSEIERLLVPLPRTSATLAVLDQALESGRPVEQILRAQDTAILGGVGVGADDRVTIHEAWARLRDRRHRRGGRGGSVGIG